MVGTCMPGHRLMLFCGTFYKPTTQHQAPTQHADCILMKTRRDGTGLEALRFHNEPLSLCRFSKSDTDLLLWPWKMTELRCYLRESERRKFFHTGGQKKLRVLWD